MSKASDIFKKRQLVPMAMKKAPEPFDDENYVFEIKFDGVRTLVYAEGKKFHLVSRNMTDFTDKFPELDLKNRRTAIFDAEICVLDENGPNFSKVARRVLAKDRVRQRGNMDKTMLMVFDILYLDGEMLIDKPLFERQEILRSTLKPSDNVQIVESVRGQGRKLFKIAGDLGLEGIVAKQRDSRYCPGKRVSTWLKIKKMLDTEFVVVYYHKVTGAISLGLAKFAPNALVYCGEVACYRRDYEFKACTPYTVQGLKYSEDNIYVEPQVYCTVSFLSWTKNGHLRHPKFKAWRPDAKRKDVTFSDEDH